MKPMKAVAYARYSSDKQQETSIVVQLAEIRKFCDNHNIELLHEYVDEAQTGTNANRKEFQQMVQDASKKEFRFIIVHRMDRLARNVDDSRHYKKYFSRYGIKIVSAVEEFDETPEGQFFELMSMGMAELYSKKLARESYAGMLANAREGNAHGSSPALGYKTENKKYVIHEQEAEAVKIMFQMTLEGYSYSQIRDYLNANGYRKKNGKPYTIHIYDALRNRKYIGEYIFNQRCSKDADGKRNNRSTKSEAEIIRIPDGVPRIIDDETFFKVQAILDERKLHPFQVAITNRKYALASLLRCNVCNAAITGSSSVSHGKRHTIYKCGNNHKKCVTKVIRCEFLEEYIEKLLARCLFAYKNTQQLTWLIKYMYTINYDKMQSEMKTLDKRIKETKEAIATANQALQEEVYKSLKVYSSEVIISREKELRELEFKKKLLEEKLQFFPSFDSRMIAKQAKYYRMKLENEEENHREVFISLARKVLIDNETIRITLNLHKLLDSEFPIVATILEKRDAIALQKHWHEQALTFSELTVEIPD